MLLMVVFPMTMASHYAMAQEVTITLTPGWNWISYPYAVAMEVNDAFGDFMPMDGDVVKSEFGFAEYHNGNWVGSLTHFIPGKGYMYYSARLEVTEFVFVKSTISGVVTVAPTDITTTSAVSGGTVTLPEDSHVFLRGVCWSTEPSPDIDGDHTSDGTGTGLFSSALDSLSPNTTYYLRAYVVSDSGLSYGNEVSFTTLDDGGNDHEYVDLGLPSGTLWATCNVGSDNPEDYGDYFAWGETETKTIYNWTTYKYCNGSPNTLTKYCNNPSNGYNGYTDNLNTLRLVDDAATANWGIGWRTPTEEEWQELYQNTTNTWTTQNGVSGRLFIGSNGNSLFLPTAGYRNDSEFYGGIGFYWSSILHPSYPANASHLTTLSTIIEMDYLSRSYGLPVRPVRSTSQSNVPTGAIDGLFSISATQQVYFSQGNLQYQASTNTWRFAENQWDYVGGSYNGGDYGNVYENGVKCSNNEISSTYSGWIDLFGWGTSGYNHGAVCYQPWSTNENASNYWVYGSYYYNLFSRTGQADWGYNAISNGGNQENSWRTLTHNEWYHVFFNRSTVSGIRYAKAQVNNVNGVILLPDAWDASIYSLNETNERYAQFNTNIIVPSIWASLEANGAVFIPAACIRQWGSIIGNNNFGNYWSASYDYTNDAHMISIGYNNIDEYSYYRYHGLSVRLVHNVE